MHSDHWKRVLLHELSRRKRIKAEHPKEYVKMFSAQPKPLNENCNGSPHVWVPATIIMIHDGGKGSYSLKGYMRRGLSEAAPYQTEEFIYVPQVCWNCCDTRVLITQKVTFAEKQKVRRRAREKNYQPKGRKGSDQDILTNFEDLCI